MYSTMIGEDVLEEFPFLNACEMMSAIMLSSLARRCGTKFEACRCYSCSRMKQRMYPEMRDLDVCRWYAHAIDIMFCQTMKDDK